MSTVPTIIDKFCEFESIHPDKLFLAEPVNGIYQTFTWKKAGREIRCMAAALQEMGFGKNDKIAILSKNCAHWIMADIAIAMAGCISVPLYPTITPGALKEIIEHSESKAVFFGKLDNPDELRNGIPGHLVRITFPFYPNKDCLNWNELVKGVEGIEGNPRIDPFSLACIAYTSGTTGQPKGVMHTFHAMGFAMRSFIQTFRGIGEEILFSYLPLCHVAERMLVEGGSIFTGSTVYFVESADTFSKNLADTKPTMFLAVPRIWEKIQEGILKKLPQKKLDMLLAVPVVSWLVKRTVVKKLGLHKTKFVLTGASPINPTLLEWYARLGLIIQEAYGMTENLTLSHVNRKGAVRFGTVGQPCEEVEVRLGKDNEIQVKSKATMLGYYKEPLLSAACFEDGFLRTGDEGFIDAAGYLTITGRIKDQFKTSKGKYIMPAPVESKFLQGPLLEQVCVTGSGMPFAMAVCNLSVAGKALSAETITSKLEELLSAVNRSLEPHEKVSKIIVVPGEWTVGNGMLTPTLKIRRKMIDETFGDCYAKWSQAPPRIILQMPVQ